MIIRMIHPNELNDLLALYSHLHKSDEPLPESSVVQAVWQELMANSRYKYFGGYVRNTLVASCTITVIPNLTRGCKPYGVIENVVTHASHRNKGYGKELLAHALAHAWSVGCYKVMLLTGRKDETTFHFYESAGFDRHAKQAFHAKPAT
jgi:GNAT superfamily N-acetyltransferase